MRLTEEQRRVIRETGLRHFGVVPRLFGSRLNDAGRWTAGEAVPRRLRFCAELRRCLGDRKIDVVVESATPSSIQDHARQRSEPV